MHPNASGEKGYFTLSISLPTHDIKPFPESKGLFVIMLKLNPNTGLYYRFPVQSDF